LGRVEDPIWVSAFHPIFADDIGWIFYAPVGMRPTLQTKMETRALTFEVHDYEWASGETPLANSPPQRGNSDIIVQRRRLVAGARAASVAPKLHKAILCLHRDDPLRRAYIRRRWTETTSRNFGSG
jgi:hypothetical protein